LRGTRRQRLWVKQERLRSSGSSAITPRGKDSVTRRNAAVKCATSWKVAPSAATITLASSA
jgi:hypothetical protein